MMGQQAGGQDQFFCSFNLEAHDPDAADWLLLRHPIGAAAVRGGASESRLPLVPPARPGRRGAGSLELLQEPAWSLPIIVDVEATTALRYAWLVRQIHREGVHA